jgi:hypothetical protein
VIALLLYRLKHCPPVLDAAARSDIWMVSCACDLFKWGYCCISWKQQTSSSGKGVRFMTFSMF